MKRRAGCTWNRLARCVGHTHKAAVGCSLPEPADGDAGVQATIFSAFVDFKISVVFLLLSSPSVRWGQGHLPRTAAAGRLLAHRQAQWSQVPTNGIVSHWGHRAPHSLLVALSVVEGTQLCSGDSSGVPHNRRGPAGRSLRATSCSSPGPPQRTVTCHQANPRLKQERTMSKLSHHPSPYKEIWKANYVLLRAHLYF